MTSNCFRCRDWDFGNDHRWDFQESALERPGFGCGLYQLKEGLLRTPPWAEIAMCLAQWGPWENTSGESRMNRRWEKPSSALGHPPQGHVGGWMCSADVTAMLSFEGWRKLGNFGFWGRSLARPVHIFHLKIMTWNAILRTGSQASGFYDCVWPLSSGCHLELFFFSLQSWKGKKQMLPEARFSSLC